jgi:hypothetical protein
VFPQHSIACVLLSWQQRTTRFRCNSEVEPAVCSATAWPRVSPGPLRGPPRLPASTDPAVFAAQRTLVEAWTIVGQAFVDPSFNGHDWQDELREHMMAAYNSGSSDDAFGEIGHMLDELGDPYTRRVAPE